MVVRQVEIDEKLIAREWPVVAIGECRECADVHQRQLLREIRRAIRRALARARRPAITDHAACNVELRFVEDLSRTLLRAPDDHLDRAAIARRRPDRGQVSIELGEGAHRYWMYMR